MNEKELKKAIKWLEAVNTYKDSDNNNEVDALLSLTSSYLAVSEKMPKKKYPEYAAGEGAIVDEATGNGIYNQAIDDIINYLKNQ